MPTPDLRAMARHLTENDYVVIAPDGTVVGHRRVGRRPSVARAMTLDGHLLACLAALGRPVPIREIQNELRASAGMVPTRQTLSVALNGLRRFGKVVRVDNGAGRHACWALPNDTLVEVPAGDEGWALERRIVAAVKAAGQLTVTGVEEALTRDGGPVPTRKVLAGALNELRTDGQIERVGLVPGRGAMFIPT